LMMPLGAVFEMAPAKVLHGAVRLHGFTSSPTPETQVRVACACAVEPQKSGASAARPIANTKADCFLNMVFLIVGLLCGMLMRSPLVRARPNPAARRNERPPFLKKCSFGESWLLGSVLLDECKCIRIIAKRVVKMTLLQRKVDSLIWHSATGQVNAV